MLKFSLTNERDGGAQVTPSFELLVEFQPTAPELNELKFEGTSNVLGERVKDSECRIYVDENHDMFARLSSRSESNSE